MTAMVVAQITKDIILIEDDISYEGKQFHIEAMADWWGWGDSPAVTDLQGVDKPQFRLYDDDGELYYEGWLYNDDQCVVQQFVLEWAKANDGCTTIKVKKDGKWVQEIG